jgi:hypothetical protein
VTQKSGVHPNQAKQALRSPDGACCATLPPAIKPTKGSSNYYRLRHNDFIKRHKACDPDKQPPAYYLQYGEKYAARFLAETSKSLSPEGQAWMNQVLINLQSILDEGVTTLKLTDERKIITPNKDTLKLSLAETRLAIMNYMKSEGYPKPYDLKAFLKGIECRSDHHFMFAFMSHPDAYMPTWLAKLPVKDLIEIGLTPDLSEWHPFGKHNKTTTEGAKATWAQAVEVGTRAAPVMATDMVIDRLIQTGTLDEAIIIIDAIDAVNDAVKKILP